MKKTITCIGCPMGCAVTATIENGEVTEVTGQTCARGEKYARTEVVHPMRTVTSTVAVDGGELSMVSVKTASDIPKDQITACMAALKGVRVSAPVAMGQVIVADVAATGIPIIATKAITAV